MIRPLIIKILYIILSIFSILNTEVLAQPGGGGGLKINNFYNDKLEQINIKTDTSIKIRTFILFNEKIYQETFLHHELLNENINQYYNIRLPQFFLPPTSDLDNDRYLDTESNQRVYIVYKKDTMIIDFMEIMGENGGGNIDDMDSLVIQRGYYKYHRSKKNGRAYNYEDYNKQRKFIANGLTPNSVKELTREGYIQFNTKIDLFFLAEQNLPSSYFLKRAGFYLQKNQTNLALTDIEIAVKKNNGVKDCETEFLYCYAYTQSGQFEKAIEHISNAIQCKRYNWLEDWESMVANYEIRIDLFIRLKKYDTALKDYDAIHTISAYKIDANVKRANFKIKYLKDYQAAISDLTSIVNSIPSNHLFDKPFSWSEYADTYFVLGTAEYLSGEKTLAFKHWLKGEEFGYRSSSQNSIIHFDSIISKNPKVSELYLARAIAHFKRAVSLGSEDSIEIIFKKSFDDLSKAEELNKKDHRINLYRAQVLNQMKLYHPALKEIYTAISKNPDDPRCYLIRYDIRRNIGLIKPDNEDDPDLQLFRQHSKNWVWQQY